MSGPCFRTHVQMTCFTDKRYEDREYLYTRTRARLRQPGYVSTDTSIWRVILRCTRPSDVFQRVSGHELGEVIADCPQSPTGHVSYHVHS